MRIAVAEYAHETNPHSSIKVTASMMQMSKLDAAQFYERSSGVRSSRGGIIDEAAALGITLVPTLFASFRPCAPAIKEVYESYRDEMIQLLGCEYTKEPFDAIALIAHGAGMADGYDDVETDIIRHLRSRFGNDIPIGITLDLHGNISPEMIDLCNVTVGCKEYPHTDSYETAREMFRLLHSQVHQKPYGKSIRKLNFKIPSAAGCTLDGPGLDIKNFCLQLQKENADLLNATVFHGFNASDVPFGGVSVVTTAVTDAQAKEFADQISDYILAIKDKFTVPVYTVSQALDLSQASVKPAVINESTDNPGSGHPGDGTLLLQEMLNRNIEGSVFAGIYDPQVAEEAFSLGVGNHISCNLGAKVDDKHGSPIAVKNAEILAISDGNFIQHSPMGYGANSKLGKTALLRINNVKIVVNSIRSQTFDDGPLRLVGIDWRDCSIIGLKSLQHFRAWWTGKAKTIIPIYAPADKQYK